MRYAIPVLLFAIVVLLTNAVLYLRAIYHRLGNVVDGQKRIVDVLLARLTR
jgi:hypothetical protein